MFASLGPPRDLPQRSGVTCAAEADSRCLRCVATKPLLAGERPRNSVGAWEC